MVYITRQATFSAAHRLSRSEWNEEKNNSVFGKCANPNWHGHNYTLSVTVKGEMNPQTGFVANLSDINKIIRAKVIDKVDHKNLNLDVDFMAGKIPSTEVLAVEIWKQIVKDIEALGCKMHSVKIQETENNFVEYLGD
jgi:6-pyruvoyltetrahydropterin/6-carboxytetrahydropterin synthase